MAIAIAGSAKDEFDQRGEAGSQPLIEGASRINKTGVQDRRRQFGETEDEARVWRRSALRRHQKTERAACAQW